MLHNTTISLTIIFWPIGMSPQHTGIVKEFSPFQIQVHLTSFSFAVFQGTESTDRSMSATARSMDRLKTWLFPQQ